MRHKFACAFFSFYMMCIMEQMTDYNLIKNRFRGYLPVIIDVETAGLNAQTDALLELAAITVISKGKWY